MNNLLIIVLSLSSSVVCADDLTARVMDRTEIERVYYNHRLGEKRPFEEVSPPVLIERLVDKDLQKEAALKKVYGVEITPAMLEGEVLRINSSSRAPDMLAEIKSVLDNDPERFAQSYAKRFLVERLLREKFENDDALHAHILQECESVRNELLAAKAEGAAGVELVAHLWQAHSNEVSETIWELGARPSETTMPSADEMEIKKRFGPDAQLLSAPQGGDLDHKFYFDDLPPELQKVLRVQLRKPGDISAVIETPSGFLLYICTERMDEKMATACLFLPKCSYEEWIDEQGGGTP